MTVIVGDIVEARGSNPKKHKKGVEKCSKIKPVTRVPFFC